MKRVLIVDDAIELGRMLKDALKTVYPAIPVSVVPSAEEALLEARRYTVDLLVTDIRLPGMTGLELIRKIRLRQPDIRVILITGLVPDERLMRQKDEARPDIFLRKPITAGVFLDSVEKLIGESQPGAPAAPSTANAGEPATASAVSETAVAASTSAASAETILRELADMLPGDPVPAAAKTNPLHKPTGVLHLSEIPEPEPSETGLSAVISRVRGRLGALSVTLLDESGRPVAQAGELPEDSSESQLIPAVIAALGAGARVAYLLGQPYTHSVQAYRGANFDLLAAPVGQYTLLIALHTGKSAVRLAIGCEEAFNAQTELAEALAAMGLRMSTTTEVGAPETLLAGAVDEAAQQEAALPPEMLETPLGQDPGLEKFEALFHRKQTGQLNMQDPDAFWEQVAGGEGGEVDQSGVLSFDQAQKLGLLPDNKPEG